VTVTWSPTLSARAADAILAAVTHVFVAPHPDDAALSCGGLIASLREVGQNVTILNVFSGGPASADSLTDYQRAALGYGNKTLWPNTEVFRRENIGADEAIPVVAGAPAWAADPERLELTQQLANTQARQFWQRASWTRSANVSNEESAERPLADSIGGQGTDAPMDVTSEEIAERRKMEDERYTFLVEASAVYLDLPDAVYRGYEGDAQLLGEVREDDPAPYEILRREIARLEPQMVYFPLGVGGHVDHQLCREVGLSLLSEDRRWVMPGTDYAGRLSFYEDFPYAWWNDFDGPADWGGLELPSGIELEARYSDISEVMDRKAAGIRLYGSQVRRLFADEQGILDDLAGYHAKIALFGGIHGYAERYWTAVRA
jgi:LmbE family N-acetylglucosaminyl deacetylase